MMAHFESGQDYVTLTSQLSTNPAPAPDIGQCTRRRVTIAAGVVSILVLVGVVVGVVYATNVMTGKGPFINYVNNNCPKTLQRYGIPVVMPRHNNRYPSWYATA